MKTIQEQCQFAKSTYITLQNSSTSAKNQALEDIALALDKHQQLILTANQKDLILGKKNNLTQTLLDRLRLTPDRIQSIIKSILTIKNLPDPIGEVIASWSRPNGLQINKIRVPLGVIGIIYEARPNVTADAIALCLKTGNCIILRGSSSAYHSNKVITDIIKKSLKNSDIPSDCIQLLEDTSRESVKTFLQMNQYLDVIIPRGGANLIQTVIKNATVPTIETGTGNCHVYIDKDADPLKAKNIIINAKTNRPSVCNATETLLIHQDIAPSLLPQIITELQAKNVVIKACPKTQALIPNLEPATELDWQTEFLDLILAVKIVENTKEAILHINKYGTKHTEAIITQNKQTQIQFQTQIDASTIIINASTRFTDGNEFGFGAEMGISTQKLHARGPLGLPELTTYKYIIHGNGQIRE